MPCGAAVVRLRPQPAGFPSGGGNFAHGMHAANSQDYTDQDGIFNDYK